MPTFSVGQVLVLVLDESEGTWYLVFSTFFATPTSGQAVMLVIAWHTEREGIL
jgi:hypothetical protein